VLSLFRARRDQLASAAHRHGGDRG
jgi:hypothetical protein